ncbi:MAG: hypothetical protein MJ072_03560, partial [Clostridia bacterium]|nr:hypothetical protein [Clostridia bacterium]
MQVITSKSNKEFRSFYGSILQSDELNLHFFILNTLSDDEFPPYAVRGGVYDNGELKLIFINAYPFNLLIYDFSGDKDAIGVLSKYICDNGIQIKGVSGSETVCENFRAKYLEHSGKNIVMNRAMDIMTVD